MLFKLKTLLNINFRMLEYLGEYKNLAGVKKICLCEIKIFTFMQMTTYLTQRRKQQATFIFKLTLLNQVFSN